MSGQDVATSSFVGCGVGSGPQLPATVVHTMRIAIRFSSP